MLLHGGDGMPNYTIAIDPSINNLGLAVFKNKTLIEHKLLKPSKGLRKAHYLDKCRDLVEQITSIHSKFSKKGKTKLVTEIPMHFGSTAERGFLARESGSVYKLTFICGMIYNIAKDVQAYEPREWKGQMPKDVVGKRLQLDYPKLHIMLKDKKGEFVYHMENGKKVFDFSMNHNIVDAIGIGHRYLHGRV